MPGAAGCRPLGMPVSTTYAITTSIMGGLCERPNHLKPRSSSAFLGLKATIPASGLVAYGLVRGQVIWLVD
jgi:phosphate/sulfate permease